VDHPETLVRENLKTRQQELGRCMEIIAERSVEFLARIAPRPERTYVPATAAVPEWPFGNAAACAG